MNRLLRGVLYGLLWALAGITIFVAVQRVQKHDRGRTITALQIDFPDSTSHGQLVTREMVLRWLKEEQIAWQDCAVEALDLGLLEDRLEKNGFVGGVKAVVDYQGVLHLEIHQREPLFRLWVDGYNHYVTEDGYLFRSPNRTALYVPVVTGTYTPPFPPPFEGWLDEHRTTSTAAFEEQIAQLEREKYPYYEREKENMEYNRITRRTFIRRGLLESREHFAKRVEETRAKKRERRRHYRYVARQIEQGIASVEARQKVLREREKKLQKNYEDFEKLTTFVRQIEADAFWRSEIVQINLSEAHSGALEIEVVPRSGAWTAELGRMEDLEQKLDKLEQFCRQGLGRVGWEEFQTIRVQYADRVVGVERKD